LTGIKNLINFGNKKYNEITHRTLKEESIIRWFDNSKLLPTEIPSLTKDFIFILSEFIILFSYF